jgi:hypothetical protein
MDKKSIILLLLLLTPAFLSYAFGVPETAITRTHLMKDVDPKSITIAVGGDIVRDESDTIYDPDFPVVYLGYAPWDWLEFGVALHGVWIDAIAAVEGKVDLVDIFTDPGRLSCLLIGGFGGRMEDDEFYPVLHGGVAVNFQVKEDLQLYLGAGTDSLSEALSLQGGLYVSVLEWLGLSLNLKLVVDPDGIEPMLSAAPLAVIH